MNVLFSLLANNSHDVRRRLSTSLALDSDSNSTVRMKDEMI